MYKDWGKSYRQIGGSTQSKNGICKRCDCNVDGKDYLSLSKRVRLISVAPG